MLLETQVHHSIDRLFDVAYEALSRRACCGRELILRHAFLFQACSEFGLPTPFLSISLLSLTELPVEGAVVLTV